VRQASALCHAIHAPKLATEIVPPLSHYHLYCRLTRPLAEDTHVILASSGDRQNRWIDMLVEGQPQQRRPRTDSMRDWRVCRKPGSSSTRRQFKDVESSAYAFDSASIQIPLGLRQLRAGSHTVPHLQLFSGNTFLPIASSPFTVLNTAKSQLAETDGPTDWQNRKTFGESEARAGWAVREFFDVPADVATSWLHLT
jgi:hypothetical protein